MPIFEYECAKCKKAFEVLVSGDSSEKIRCPHCSSRKATKIFSGFSVGTGKAKTASGGKSSSSCTTCASKTCSSCR